MFDKDILTVIIIGYLVLINITGLLVMGVDKLKAKMNGYRIPEKVLFLVAILGGCFGTTLGMYFFRHKTRHWYFKIGMPVICILWGYCIFRIFCL